VLEATDRGEAVRQLGARHLQPVSVATVERDSKSGGAVRREDEAGSLPLKLKPSQVTLFVEELAHLLAGGIQLEPALGIMERRRELSGLKELAARVRARIRDGESFAAAVQAASPSFGEMFCNLAVAGEMSGSLGSVL
jgi:type II secretory pathway component PulF